MKRDTKRNMKKGFTVIEITIVVVLIGILVAIAIPIYRTAVVKGKEAVLKENLFQIRDAINKYYKDKTNYPTSLEDLVNSKYLRKIPYDPIAKTHDWELVRFEPDDMEDFDPDIAEGIIDVKSTSDKISLEQEQYNEW